MNEKVGKVFSIAKDNAPVKGCTISKEVQGGEYEVSYFSMAPGTDISAEIYPYNKMIVVADGALDICGDTEKRLYGGDMMITPADQKVGIKSCNGAVYTEMLIRRNGAMNDAIKAGEVFKLVDLVPYQNGKIVNMDVVSNDKMKFVIMSFDEGTGLSEHAAPGEAIVFALDGEGIIGYGGEKHPIKAGENFHFAKGGMHTVTASGRFKMALLLTLE